MNKELFTNGSIEGKANIPKSYKCAYCLKEFEKAPKEHILQNTFGAKWTSNTISCEECQEYFGKHFDVPCEEHIRLYRNLLNTGTDRERKKVPKINDVQCDNGYSYTLHPGGVPNLSKPHIEKTPDGCRIIMGRMKDIEQGLHLAKKILGAEELLIEGEPLKVREKLPPLHYRFPRVGLTVAKAFLKAGFNMLAEKNKELSLSSVFNDFRTFMMEGGEEDLSSFFRFPAEKICLLDEFETAFHHQLYVYSRGSTVEGAIKIFGAFMYHLRFSNTYKGESFCYAYITDPQKITIDEKDSTADLLAYMPSFDRGVEINDASALAVEKEEYHDFMKKVGLFHLCEEFKEVMSRIEKILHQKEGKRAD